MNYHYIIKRPLITEKTNIQKDIYNQFSFEVDNNSNRIQIKQAVEYIFDTKVLAVNIMQIKGKKKRKGHIIGKHKDWKKAIVTLMADQKIKFFEDI